MEKLKAMIMDDAKVSRSLARIAHEIIERDEDADEFVVIGIKRRGISLAKEIAEDIKKFSNIPVISAELDVALYRDDVVDTPQKSAMKATNLTEKDISDKVVILVDDVIYTGRTVRAAMDAIVELGRPKAIRFAALIDRGHREFPVKPDFVGKNVPTSPNETIRVYVPEYDGEKKAVLNEIVS